MWMEWIFNLTITMKSLLNILRKLNFLKTKYEISKNPDVRVCDICLSLFRCCLDFSLSLFCLYLFVELGVGSALWCRHVRVEKKKAINGSEKEKSYNAFLATKKKIKILCENLFSNNFLLSLKVKMLTNEISWDYELKIEIYSFSLHNGFGKIEA